MSVQRLHEATDCVPGSTDWTTIGARILQVASMTTAIHLDETARRTDAGWEPRRIGEWNHQPERPDIE